MKRHRALISNLNYQDPFGNTLLHGAAVSGDLREVERLLAAGADPTIANRDGHTALHAAAILGQREVYELLAARNSGSDPKSENQEDSGSDPILTNQEESGL